MSHYSATQRQMVTCLRNATGVSDRTAKQALAAAGWDLEDAIEEMLDGDLSRSRAAGPPVPKTDAAKISKLFEKYKDQNEDAIRAEGLAAFCEDLGVEPDDVALLVISWHFRAETMLEYSRGEFEGGLSRLGCDTIAKLRKRLPELRAELDDTRAFREIYAFAYLWGREKGVRCVQQDVAVGLWKLLLSGGRWPLIGDWCDFLAEKHNRVISRDTWTQLPQFIEIEGANFEKYDEAGSWPYLFDDFVDYMRKRGNEKEK